MQHTLELSYDVYMFLSGQSAEMQAMRSIEAEQELAFDRRKKQVESIRKKLIGLHTELLGLYGERISAEGKVCSNNANRSAASYIKRNTAKWDIDVRVVASQLTSTNHGTWMPLIAEVLNNVK